MPLFKSKKAKNDHKSQGAKGKRLPEHDRFMRAALRANLPESRSGEIADYDFADTFSEKKLKIVGRVTDRALLGRGEFDRVYQLAKDATRAYERDVTQQDQPDPVQVAALIATFEKLEKAAAKWLDGAEAKWSNKDESKRDTTSQIKQIEAQGLLKGARTTLFQLRNLDKLRQPETQKLLAGLDLAREKARGGDTKATEGLRSLDAKVLTALCGSDKPGNGTSDVKLVRGPGGDVAYAFKSVDGESDMMGVPKGYATAREVMMSALVDKLRAGGLDFGWPKVSMAKMGNQSGALIDGVGGQRCGPNQTVPQDQVPAKALQKALLCNLAGGQFDIKWEDMRLIPNGDTMDAVCMDGGASMPDPDTAASFLIGLSDGRPGATLVDNGVGQILPQAREELGADLVAQFLALDTVALRADLKAETLRLEQDHGLDRQQLSLDEGVGTSITCIEGIQKILRDANGKISLADLLDAFHTDVIDAQFVTPKRQAWETRQMDDYKALIKAHPRLFSPADQVTDIADLYRGMLLPSELAHLTELVALAQAEPQGGTVADMLERYGEPLPVKTLSTALAALKSLQKAMSDGLPEYDKLVKMFPGVIVPKDSFPTLLQAHLDVVKHRFGLTELRDKAAKLSSAEGQTVTVADLMTRHGVTLPTSRFKDINAQIGQADRLAQQQGQA